MKTLAHRRGNRITAVALLQTGTCNLVSAFADVPDDFEPDEVTNESAQAEQDVDAESEDVDHDDQ